ncbi:dihydrofolate reductase [Candidatus Peregrinibacteria bacterium]|nr:dihydrofolate reductase [Candidatus Peregrinibacteria bacterium]
MTHPIYMIVAVDEHHGIGKDGHLPWKLKKEYKYFRDTTRKVDDLTKQNMVIMGHHTWDSLEPEFRPLPNRKNVILTRNTDYKLSADEKYQDVSICNSIDKAIALADDKIEKIFILGGGQIFKEFINNPRLTGIYLTKVHKTFDCDTFFPEIPATFKGSEKIGSDEENGISYDFLLFSHP